jgi:hypothetical protein
VSGLSEHIEENIIRGRSAREIMMTGDEPLHPELESARVEVHGIPAIHHRYMISIPHIESMNAITNARFEIVKLKAKEMFEKGDYLGYVFGTERPYRLDALLDVMAEECVMKPLKEMNQELAYLVIKTWRDSEAPWVNNDTWRSIMRRVGHDNLLLEASSSIEAGTAVYRGISLAESPDTLKDGGMSWTIDYDKAKWFATRHDKGFDSYVLETACDENFIGVFDERGESEVIAINPIKSFTFNKV